MGLPVQCDVSFYLLMEHSYLPDETTFNFTVNNLICISSACYHCLDLNETKEIDKNAKLIS